MPISGLLYFFRYDDYDIADSAIINADAVVASKPLLDAIAERTIHRNDLITNGTRIVSLQEFPFAAKPV